jgi:hypothetical protein
VTVLDDVPLDFDELNLKLSQGTLVRSAMPLVCGMYAAF